MRACQLLVALALVFVTMSTGSITTGRLRSSARAEMSCSSGEGKKVDSSFFSDVLANMQMPPNPLAIQALTEWQPYEGTDACWNPLSTILGMPGSHRFNCLDEPQCNMGVQDFPDKVTGELALASTLMESRYTSIVDFLSGKAFNYLVIQSELDTWGAGDYSDELTQKWQRYWRQARQDVLAPPSELSALQRASGQVDLHWRDNASNEANFSIWRWNGRTWSQVATVDSNTMSYSDSPGADDVTHFYTVCVAGYRDATCSNSVAQAMPPSASSNKASAPVKPHLLITSLTTLAYRGSSAFLRIVTEPNAICSVGYGNSGGKLEAVSDMGQKTADKSGVVTWSWVIRTTEANFDAITVKCGETTETRPFRIL